MAPLLAGFSGLVGCRCRCFVSAKKKRGRFLFFVSIYSKGEPTENPRSPKNRGAYEEKNQRSFSFATNKTRAVPFFLRCLLSTWVVATNTRVFARRAGLLLVRYKQHHSSTTTIEFVLPFFLGVNARQALQCAEFLSSCLLLV